MFKEIKILGKQSTIYGFGSILTKGLGFFLIPLYTHFLTPKDYGTLEMIDLTCIIVSFFLGMGISNSILRFHGQYTDEKDKEEVINSGLLFAIVIGSFITIILVLNNKIFSKLIFSDSQYSYYFIIAFINIFLAIIYTHCLTIYRVNKKAGLFVTVSVITTVIALLLNILFIGILQIGIRGFYYSSIIAFFPVTLILLFKQFTKNKVTISTEKISKMFNYGIFFLPTLLISFVINFSDRIFLRIYENIETVGLYALGYKIGMILVFLLGYPFRQAWGAYAFEIEGKENAKEIFSKILSYYAILLLFLALAIAVLSKEIITIIADPSYLMAYKIIPLITFSAVFLSIDHIMQIGILIKKKTLYLPFINGFVAVVNILLNIYLIPKYGMIGAGISTLVSFMILPIISFYVSQRLYPVGYEIGHIIKIMLITLVLYLISIPVNTDSLIQTIMIKTIIIGGFPISLFIFNILSDVEKEKVYNLVNSIRNSKA